MKKLKYNVKLKECEEAHEKLEIQCKVRRVCIFDLTLASISSKLDVVHKEQEVLFCA